MEWLGKMKQIYHKSSSKHSTEESYFKNFKDILAICYQDMINNEAKRCKEKSVLLQQLYNESIEYFDNVLDYVRLYLTLLDKNHKNDIDQICQEYNEQMDSQQF